MSMWNSSQTLRGLYDIEPIYQGEISECGVACVAMLLQALGIESSLADVRKRYGASLLGMSLVDLVEALESYDVASDPVRFDPEALVELPLPAILHVRGNHFVLVMRAAGDLFQVFDPAVGVHLLHRGVLAGVATGYALILGEDERPRPRARNSGQRPSRMRLAQAGGIPLVSLMLISGALSFMTPLFVGTFVDRLLNPGGMHAYWSIGCAFLAAVLGAFAFERFCGRTLNRHCASVGMLALDRAFSRLIDNRLGYFSRRTPGDLVERFSAYGDAAIARVRLGNTMFCAVLVAIVAILAMAWLQPWLAIISMVGIAISGLITQRYGQHAQSLRMDAEVVAGNQRQFMLETIQGIHAWKSALGTRRRAQAFADHGCATIQTWRRQADLGVRQQTAYKLLGNVELLVMLGVAANAMLHGELSFGAFYAFTFLRQIAFASATAGYGAWVGARSNRVAEARAQDMFEQERDVYPDEQQGLEQSLQFDQLNFRHPGSPLALEDICLSIRPGERIALIGESGSGKTTLLSLLAGMETPSSGALRIDGELTDRWERLRRYCHLQTSSDILFTGTLLENISMFAPNPDRACCQKLVDAVGMGQRVAALPGGIDTLLTDATASLSAGERQRIMVARALYARRSVSIFDEPTANLDADSALAVIDAITRHAHAAIVVTHDRSHLHLFDAVYELRDGRLHRFGCAVETESIEALS